MSTSRNLFAFGALAATAFSSVAFAEVKVNLKIENAHRLVGTKDVVAKVSFTNTDDKPVRMLNYLMKANQNGELEENLFSITRDGMPVTYEGMHVKRAAPKAFDYINIRPGATVSYSFELSQAYNLKEAGNYTFQYNAHGMNLFSELPMADAQAAIKGMDGIESNTVNAFMVQSGNRFETTVSSAKPCNPNKQDCGDGGGNNSGIEFTGGCSSGEQSDLISALAAARNIADDSVAYLNAGNTGPRYTTWFGSYSSKRFSAVSGNFNAIKNAIDTKPMTFDCSCNQSYFAYVYPSQPYKVYFCNAFWRARETGTDSRSGTIIHELSHFNVVAGTDDIVYGQSGAKSLAISNPNGAVNNADSHEYFAENTPRLD